MQTILLIRHAKAKDREEWTGDDRLRPLTSAGRDQAKAIAKAIAKEWSDEGIASIRTSPARRCVQTVEPLAKHCGIELEIDQTLMEGSPIAMPDSGEAGVHVICAHGDNIPWLLASLEIEMPECRKGSVWVLHRDSSSRIARTRYIAPPEV